MRYSERNVKNILEKFKVKNIDDLFKEIGSGKILPVKIISSMFPEKKLLKEDDKIVLLNKIREKKKSLRFTFDSQGAYTWYEYTLCQVLQSYSRR